MKMNLFQPFHLVTVSPWPLLSSMMIFSLLTFVVNWFYLNKVNYMLYLVILILVVVLFQWWRDVVREGLFQGFHTVKVVRGLKYSFILFIICEVFFFISIFWCYLHMSLSPSVEIGGLWPPLNLNMFNPYLIPLMNTLILLSSGGFVTLSHYSLLNNKKYISIFMMFMTIFLGWLFSLLQYMEYEECGFTFCDSVFGSIFFLSTGFHGVHVLAGSMFLLISLLRMIMKDFSSIHHFGVEASIWYWHFVDVVWLFLYLLVYFWFY
uniref:Cytochrome c oxidase subunit 3 n=1 Tax=Encyrtus infelix TaxID=355422 RepID=A0A411FRB3_9HYME|nr:cytochrome c oxidase subunit III [Encyrtus infelix]QBA96082.1 cytochrome c oxidase subunit III [Encyrtus infelix]QBA96095.1 cytochrome c oxidase subunit III [Encyrtus infelix]